MAFFSSIDVIGSGFTAQQLRLDVISENIVNMNTTRTENGEGPYRRKVVTFQAADSNGRVRNVRARRASQTPGARGVPQDPGANEDGYVELPNVDLVKEITDGMAASQAFSANITAFNLLKNLISKGLEIGK